MVGSDLAEDRQAQCKIEGRYLYLNKLWKIVFYILLVLFLLALGLQIYEYSYSDMIKVISLDATWAEAKKALGWYALGLFVLNAFAYKMQVFDSPKNQIVNGLLACSVLSLLYYSVSHLLMPYIFFAQLGRLDLFLI